MKKLLVALASLALAITVGFSASATAPAPARASTTWCDNYPVPDGTPRDYAGYSQSQVNEVANGGGPSGAINFKSFTPGGGLGAAWIGVEAANGNWVQAGLIVYNSDPTVVHEYVEWNDAATGGGEHFYPNLPTVPFNTAINVSITRLNSGTPTAWSATVGGSTIFTGYIPGHWYNKTFTSENQNTPTLNTCNGLVARFSATSVQRANMAPTTNLPDWVDTLGTTSWNSNAPYLSR